MKKSMYECFVDVRKAIDGLVKVVFEELKNILKGFTND